MIIIYIVYINTMININIARFRSLNYNLHPIYLLFNIIVTNEY